MTSSQDADWMSNIYVLTTTRILGVFGMTYLIKSSYQLYKTMRASDRAVISGEMIEVEEETPGLELDLDGLLSEGSDGFSMDVITNVDETMGIRPPQPVYYPDVRRPGLFVSAEDDRVFPNNGT